MAEANMREGDPSHRRLGQLTAGTVSLARPWGVYVDLGLEHAGYIDPMFVQDDLYEVGGRRLKSASRR